MHPCPVSVLNMNARETPTRQRSQLRYRETSSLSSQGNAVRITSVLEISSVHQKQGKSKDIPVHLHRLMMLTMPGAY